MIEFNEATILFQRYQGEPEINPDLSFTQPYVIGDESFELGEDTRHGTHGFRAIRRVWNGKEFMWDEDYQFYKSLDAFYLAFMSQDYEAGQGAF